jgi:tRNA A37 threonylcarbamoyladenosine dehydratase
MSELHRFSRNELLFGPEGVRKLKDSTVAVFGLGGVGGYAAEALCRGGVGRIVIVDFDDICPSNINRQIHAMEGTLGKSKALVMAERMRLINPEAEIIPYKDFYSSESSGFLLSTDYDYVVDAIDHITSKLHLIKCCREMGIPIVSSMGAAAKLDPTKIGVADIAKTHKCRMARSVRRLLKRQGIETGVKVVFSAEEYRSKDSQEGLSEGDAILLNKYGQDDSFKHRKVILGSSSFIPPIFGFTLAGVVINDLLTDKKAPLT